MRIAIVEDNRALANGIAHHLRDQGHSVNLLYDGQAALEFLQQEKSDNVKIEVNLQRHKNNTIIKTKKNLKKHKIKSIKDIGKTDKPLVSFSDKIQNSEREIKSFLRTKMYQNNSVLKKNQKGKLIVKKLFNIIKLNPRKFLTKEQLTKDKYRAISDFISGMTDRYAINLYNNNK